MFTIKFWKATLEWVLTGVVGGLASAYLTGGIHSWEDVGKAAAGAAATSLIKALGASFKGDPASPAIVEPDPVVRVVPQAAVPPARRATVRPMARDVDRWRE